MPRRYRMTSRREDRARTRARIVASAVELHAARGVGATSWDDIAAAAGVNRATVYRHFPGLGDLIPACARTAFEAIDLPAPEVLRAQLADLADPIERMRRVVLESCACYERGAGWLRAARREADLIPALAEVNARITAGIVTLLDVALEGRAVRPEARTLLIVLGDYPFWQQLVDAGISRRAVPGLITDLMIAALSAAPRGGGERDERR